MNGMNKKGILVVSFGTTYEKTRIENIGAVEDRIRDAFKDYEVRRAFTSKRVMEVLRQRDSIVVDDTKEALDKMIVDGFVEVIIQPLHIIPGIEYEKILDVYRTYSEKFKKISVGRPILCEIEDYKEAVSALKFQLPELDESSAVVLMGHGTPHFSNSCYSCFQAFLEEEGLNVFVGTVEGYPEIQNIIPKLKKAEIKEIILMPYMLVAGDHAINDMSSDEEDSWKTILKSEGFEVKTYLHGLGENRRYQEIYVNRVREEVEKNN